jgi:hypothetical protein
VEVRRSLPGFLSGAAGRGCAWVGEPAPNPHAAPGQPLYERFLAAWVEIDMEVRLVIHGTAGANAGAICAAGLDPQRCAGQAMGPGEYFAGQAATSVSYCKVGKAMLVFAVLTDPSGITLDNGSFVVVHKVEHQLPLFTVLFGGRAGGGHGYAAAAAAAGGFAYPESRTNPLARPSTWGQTLGAAGNAAHQAAVQQALINFNAARAYATARRKRSRVSVQQGGGYAHRYALSGFGGAVDASGGGVLSDG